MAECKELSCPSYTHWYRADSVEHVNDGENVNPWGDQGGDADLANATQAQQPTLELREFNEFPSVSYTVGQFNSVTSNMFNHKRRFSVNLLIRTDDLTENEYFLGYGFFSTDWSLAIGKLNGGGLVIRLPDANPQLEAAAPTGTVAAIFTDTTTFYRIAIIYDGKYSTNATRLRVYLDGVQQTVVFSGTIPAQLQEVDFNQLFVTLFTGFPTLFAGSIPEMIINLNNVNEDTTLAVDSYLETKYNL